MKAVITGDIVNSTELSDRDRVLRSLKYVFGSLADRQYIQRSHWTIFKGDSFQVITQPHLALRVMLVLRSAFTGGIYRLAARQEADAMLKETFDVRLSCGIGSTEKIPKKITEAYGEAFILSGKMLDEITRTEMRMMITTRNNDLNNHFEIICRFADLIVSDWTDRSAQAMYRRLLLDETQQESAQFFRISQSSVQHRLKIGRYEEIRYILAYFEEQMLAYAKLN